MLGGETAQRAKGGTLGGLRDPEEAGLAVEGRDVALLELAGSQAEARRAPARRAPNLRRPAVLAVGGALDDQMAVVELVRGRVGASGLESHLIFVFVRPRVVSRPSRSVRVEEEEVFGIKNGWTVCHDAPARGRGKERFEIRPTSLSPFSKIWVAPTNKKSIIYIKKDNRLQANCSRLKRADLSLR